METTSPVMSITDEQVAEIEALASKATPGQWWIDSHGHNMVSLDDCQPIFSAKDLIKPAVRHPETGNLSHWPNDWDASYIATANPAKILALISRLRAAELDAARIEWLASQCEMRYGHREHAQYSADFGIFFQSDRDQCRPCDFRAAVDTAMKGEQQ